MIPARAVIFDRIAITVLAVALIVVWARIGDFGSRVTDTQRALGAQQKTVEQEQADIAQSAVTSCYIQSRGLQSQRYLTGALDGIHALLTLPVTAAQRAQRRTIPAKLLKYELGIVHTLNHNLASYVAIQKQQPDGRLCK